jgi:hypothetical protein
MRSCPVEVSCMAESYTPKVNDVVFMKGQSSVSYVVTQVDDTTRRADVKTVSGAIIHRDIPWPELYQPDERQNAASR